MDRSLSGHTSAVFTGRLACTHHRTTFFRHHRFDIRKVNVDRARTGDQFSDALNSTEENIVGGLEGIA